MRFSTKSIATKNMATKNQRKINNELRCIFLSMFLIIFCCDAMSQATPMMRLKMNGLVNSLDETVIYYQSGATDGFDSDFDAYKLLGPNPAPHISQEVGSILMVINGIEPVVQTFSINIKATTHITGNFTITANDFADLPKGTCVYLKDVFTGTIVNILTSSYAFNLSSTTSTSRFILSITHFELPIVSNLTQPTCHIFNGGKFKVAGTTNAPWNYIWKDSTGTIVKTVLNSSTSDSLENLSNGNYSVEITSSNNSCYLNETTFTINQIIYEFPIVSELKQPTCQTHNGGKFKVSGINNAPWNYIWKDSTGTIVKTLLNSSTSDSLANISNGNYSVEITSSNNSCYFKDTVFSINQVVLPNISFTSPDTITASSMQNYTPLNQSTNCESYFWDFGDANGNSNDFEPSYSYSVFGLYKTKLIGVSYSGCIDSTEKFVSVIDISTDISVEVNQNIKLTDMGNNQFKIILGKYLTDEINISLIDFEGKNILKKDYNTYGVEEMTLNLEEFNTGIYILSIGMKNNIQFCSKIFIK